MMPLRPFFHFHQGTHVRTTRKWSLNVPNELWLDLSGLTANIRAIGCASPGLALIEAEGDERLLGKLDLRHDTPAEVALDYGPGPITIRIGNSVMSNGGRQSGVNVLSNIRGRSVSICNVVVNGVSVTSVIGDSDAIFDIDALPIVAISLPPETKLHIKAGGGSKLFVAAMKERFRLAVTGSCDAIIQDVVAPEIRLSGSGQISLSAHGDTVIELSGSGNCHGTIAPNADGRAANLDARVSGSGNVRLRGSVGKAALAVAGSGMIYLSDECAEADAQISGSGLISIRKVTGALRQRTSRSGQIKIG